MPDPVEGAKAVGESWPLIEVVLATGAVGTAAAGIVDGLKGTRLGLFGFGKIADALGPELMKAVERAYGTNTKQVLQGFYRQQREGGMLGKALRQGVRVGVRKQYAGALASALGDVVARQEFEAAVGKVETGHTLSDQERSVIGRFELAVDARIDAALALADASYVAGMRGAASLVAVALALVGTQAVTAGGLDANLALGFVIGVAAVPLAPIAKDVASGLRSARQAATAATGART